LAAVDRLDILFVPLDRELAWTAGSLEPRTRTAGLSLTDRSCLALAVRLGVPALTGDRAWSRVASEVGATVEQIR